MLYCMYCTMYVMVLYVMVCYVLPSLSTLVLKFTFCIGDGVPVTSKSDIQLVNYNKNQATVRVCVYVSTPPYSVLVLPTEFSVGWEGKKEIQIVGGPKQYYRL